MVKRCDIRYRLGATFCLLASVLFVIGWQGIHHLRQLDREMRLAVYDRLAEEQQVSEAFQLSDLNSRVTISLFLLDDPDEIKRQLNSSMANSERITELINAIETRLDSDEEKRLLAAVKAAREPYVESYRRALAKLLDEHQRDEARKMMVGVSLPLVSTYHSAWSAFTQFQIDQIEKAITQSKVSFQSAERDLLVQIVLAALITTAVAAFVTVRLTREIAERQQAAENLSKAYDHLERRVEQRTAELAQRQPHVAYRNVPAQEVRRPLAPGFARGGAMPRFHHHHRPSGSHRIRQPEVLPSDRLHL